MKILLSILTLITFVQFCSANEQAIASAKSHLSNNILNNSDGLTKSYAQRIMLMPGHEFLKEKYGLAEPGGRARGLEVARGDLLAAMKKAAEGRPVRPASAPGAAAAAGLGGNSMIYARFFIHAITDEEQASFLDFCAAYIKAHGGRAAFEFRTPMDERLTKVTGAHYRRYVDPVDFLSELFKRGLTASYMVQGTGLAKYKTDDAHVVRLLVERAPG